MSWKPTPWIAAVLNILAAPLGFLYIGKALWAVGYIALLISMSAIGFFRVLGGALAMVPALLLLGCVLAGALIAYRVARHPLQRARPWYSRWYGLLAVVAAFTLANLTIRAFLYEPYRAPSTSMAPTIQRGANLIVQKIGYGHVSTFGLQVARRPISAPIKRGDIIVFDFPVDPSQTYLKRIVGLPGDQVVYRDKHVFVNGRESPRRQLADYLDPESPRLFQRFRESLDNVEFDTLQLAGQRPIAAVPKEFALRENCTYAVDGFVCKVPAGNYFVMGDNRDNSFDSRYWGFVRSDQIIGKVVKIIQ